MKCSNVVIRWNGGLQLIHAARLVQTAKRFRSSIILKCGGTIADARSVLSVLALCAVMGTAVEVETTGADEQEASQAIEQLFASRDHGES